VEELPGFLPAAPVEDLADGHAGDAGEFEDVALAAVVLLEESGFVFGGGGVGDFVGVEDFLVGVVVGVVVEGGDGGGGRGGMELMAGMDFRGAGSGI
jgi:hypothetical protein